MTNQAITIVTLAVSTVVVITTKVLSHESGHCTITHPCHS